MDTPGAGAGEVVDLGIEGYEGAVEIGRGGFGVVYRARQPALNRTVAIKVLSGALDEGARQRFERERGAMGALSGHPNIVTVLESGTTRTGEPFITMPCLEAGSLAHLVTREGAVPWERAVHLGVRLAGALETAHRAGTIHRDVKPENVLLSDYGEPQLADFGIARVAGGYETSTRGITASLTHAAPEVLEGGRESPASDVYSLASTVFTLVAGHPAFPRRVDEPLAAQLYRIVTAPVPDLRPRGVPDALCAALEGALAKDPAGRPPSAADFGAALRDVQRAHDLELTEMVVAPVAPHSASAAPLASSPSSPGALSHTSGVSRRRRTWILAAVGATVAVVAAVAGGMATGLLSPASDDKGSDVGAGPAGLEAPEGLALTSSGRILVADTGHHRVVALSDGGDVEVVAGTGEAGSEGDGGPATSARLAHPVTVAEGSDGTLYVADSENGVVRRIVDGRIETLRPEPGGDIGLYASALAVGGEGRVYVATDTRVYAIEPDGALVTVAGTGTAGFSGDGGPATDARVDGVRGLTVAPDGSLYVADTGNNRVRRITADGTIVTVAGNGSTRYPADGDGEPATDAGLNAPVGLAADADGHLFIAEYGSGALRRLAPDGTISSLVPDHDAGFAGDGGPARLARLNGPRALAVSPDGTIYVLDSANHRLRRLTPSGTITTIG